MLKIFISHSMAKRDAKVLTYLNKKIRTFGFQPYFAEHSLSTVNTITEKIKKEIALTNLVLVFLSKSAVQSQFVQQEVGLAEANDKPLLIIKEKGVKMKGVLYGRDSIELDYLNSKEFTSKFNNWLRKTHSSVKRQKLLAKKRKEQNNKLAAAAILVGLLIWGASDD